MALDPRIPLLGQTPDFSQIPNTLLNTAAGVQDFRNKQAILQLRQQEADMAAQEQPLRLQGLQQQVESGRLQNARARQEQFTDEQRSVIHGAAGIKPLLDAGDVEGVRANLTQRQSQLQALGLNTADTDAALQMLDADPTRLRSMVDSLVNTGLQTGVLEAPKQKDLTGLIGKATPESIARFQQSGNYADLQEAPETISPEAAARLAIDRERLGLERERVSIDREKLAKGPEGNNTFKNAAELRKEFINQSKEFAIQTDAVGRIEASASDPSAAGDLALIFSYMKTLDPGSTVREGEFATAQNAGGVPDRAVAAYNKVLSGQRLAPEQRKDFVNRAKKIYQQASSQHKKRESEYSRLATQNDIDPANVIVDFSAAAPTPAAPTGLQPGGSVVINGITVTRKR